MKTHGRSWKINGLLTSQPAANSQPSKDGTKRDKKSCRSGTDGIVEKINGRMTWGASDKGETTQS